jgi:hypothetical protein
VYRVIHPTGGRLSMRFSDLRLHTTDRIQVGLHCEYKINQCCRSGSVLIPIDFARLDPDPDPDPHLLKMLDPDPQSTRLK